MGIQVCLIQSQVDFICLLLIRFNRRESKGVPLRLQHHLLWLQECETKEEMLVRSQTPTSTISPRISMVLCLRSSVSFPMATSIETLQLINLKNAFYFLSDTSGRNLLPHGLGAWAHGMVLIIWYSWCFLEAQIATWCWWPTSALKSGMVKSNEAQDTVRFMSQDHNLYILMLCSFQDTIAWLSTFSYLLLAHIHIQCTLKADL